MNEKRGMIILDLMGDSEDDDQSFEVENIDGQAKRDDLPYFPPEPMLEIVHIEKT